MDNCTDGQLLARFTAQKSEEAFARIVSRYLNLVYASALRQVTDPATAEDVPQAVFILLAKKAATLRRAESLPAWLMSVTRFASRDALKRQATRRRHELKPSP